MSNIKGKNTQPEIKIRKALHSKGFRYKINDKTLYGKPDLVFPKYKAVILINGCFWHKHNCHLFKWPSSRKQFWREKITNTAKKDNITLTILKSQSWRVLIVWECAIKGRTRLEFDTVINTIVDWLESDNKFSVIEGREYGSC